MTHASLNAPEAAAERGPLGAAAFGGALHTGLSQAVRAVLLLVSTIIVARILTPDDYGVIAMAAPVLVFVLLLQDLGLSAATVQARSITDEQCSTLFWVTIAVSAVIALLLLLAAPLLASFYREPRVADVTAASAAIVLITGTALQHTALLAREMKFRAIARAVLLGAVVNFVATVGFALWLRSYWAIFLGNFAGTAAQAAATWLIQRWRPRRPATLAQTASMLRLGGAVAGFDLLNFFSRHMDEILIGRYWGAAPLGLYERSYALMIAPIQLVRAPIARVMLPVLSRLIDAPARYRRAYLSSLRAVLLVTAPAAAVAIATSEELVPLLLGDHWRDASPIFLWLALASFYLPVASSTGLLFVSTARARSLVAWGIFSSLTTVVALVIGLPWGPVGVAKAYVAATMLQTIIVVGWASRGTAVRPLDVAVLFLPFVIAAASIWGFVRAFEDLLDPLPLVLASLPPAYLATTLLVGIFPEGRSFLLSTTQLARDLMSPRRRSVITAGANA